MKKNKFKKINISFLLRIVISIVAAVSIVFVAASSFSNVTLSNITGTLESFFLNLKKGEGYPYECSVGGADKSEIIGSYLALIDESNVIFLNKTAKEILYYDSTYTDPDISVSNGRALVYNRGTSAFFLTGQSDVLYKTSETIGVLDDSIITATIGKSGNLAFATWSDEGTSRFTALNKKLGKEFYYVFGTGRVLSVALSDNGKYGACAVFDVENATYYSEIYVFDFDKSEPIKKVKYENETVLQLDFLSNKKLSVVTDSKRRVVHTSDKEDENILDYSTHTIKAADFNSATKKSVVCYSKYGSSSNVITAFYKNGKESCSIEDIENVKDISCNSKLIAVLTSDKVFCYSYRGNLKCTIDLKFNIDSIELGNSEVYLFSGSNVYRSKTNKDTVLET